MTSKWFRSQSSNFVDDYLRTPIEFYENRLKQPDIEIANHNNNYVCHHNFYQACMTQRERHKLLFFDVDKSTIILLLRGRDASNKPRRCYADSQAAYYKCIYFFHLHISDESLLSLQRARLRIIWRRYFCIVLVGNRCKLPTTCERLGVTHDSFSFLFGGRTSMHTYWRVTGVQFYW